MKEIVKQISKANYAQICPTRSVKQKFEAKSERKIKSKSSAFGVAAGAAQEAALLIDQQVATVGALTGYVPDGR